RHLPSAPPPSSPFEVFLLTLLPLVPCAPSLHDALPILLHQGLNANDDCLVVLVADHGTDKHAALAVFHGLRHGAIPFPSGRSESARCSSGRREWTKSFPAERSYVGSAD